MLDLEGRVASWNGGAERIKGYLPEEILGEHFSKFYTQTEQEERASTSLGARGGGSRKVFASARMVLPSGRMP